MHFANLLDVLKVIVCFKKVTASICITAVERGSFFSPHIWNVNALNNLDLFYLNIKICEIYPPGEFRG